MALLKTDWPALVGKKFGFNNMLEVVAFLGRRSDRQRYFLCRCQCGTEKEIRGDAIIHERLGSCGCSQYDQIAKTPERHRTNRTPTWQSYHAMMVRCFKKSCTEYDRYGGVGITVCERWADPDEGLNNFIADMGLRPDGKTLDRYPNQNGNYEPGNCRWATDVEQNRNRRNNRWIEIDGEKKLARDWALIAGVTSQTVWDRFQKGVRSRSELLAPSGRKNKVCVPQEH